MVGPRSANWNGERRLITAMAVLMLAAMFAVGSATRDAHAATFTVIGTADTAGTCPTAATCASLRQAITSANNSAGADTIVFDIAGAGPHVINVASALPTITQPLTINGFCGSCDGATANSASLFQPINAVYKIIVDGPGASADGFVINSATAVTIRGLNIRDFGGSAVNLAGGSLHVIAGNFFGTNESGTVAQGAATGNHIAVTGVVSNPMVGGANAADRNLISGKSGNGGVGINGALNSATLQGMEVLGNYIGTNAAGTAAIGNQTGVAVSDVSQFIGGAGTGRGNLISGNVLGISIGTGASSISISGNRIGTNAAGLAAVGNSTGITSEGVNSNFGTAVVGGGNLIAGNSTGIFLSDPSDSINVVNNAFGLGADGGTLIPNTIASLRMDGASNIDVGLAAANGGNRFVGDSSLVVSNQHGIQITSIWSDIRITNNIMGFSLVGPAGQRGNAISASGTGQNLTLTGNFITYARITAVNLLMDSLTGFSMKGNSIGMTEGGGAAGNLSTGVLANNTTGVIGGPGVNDPNIIAFNDGDGVALTGSSNVTISRNSIYLNGGSSQAIGIDLGNDGQPTNDSLDPDNGPNGLLNRPENQSAFYVNGASATGRMLIRSLPNTVFTVELFRTEYCISQGPQGQIFVGSFAAQPTDASGFRSFVAEWPGAQPGDFVVATITDPDGNTSEFNSGCSPVLRPGADVNCDNAVTAVDILAALNSLAGIETGPQADTCVDNPLPSPIDVNLDQSESLADAISIAQTVAGLRGLDGNPVN